MIRERKVDRFKKLSSDALEEYAASVLVADKISGEASTQAALGFRLFRFPIERPIDVRETKAAKELKAALLTEGFKVEWEQRKVLASGYELTAWTLRLDW